MHEIHTKVGIASTTASIPPSQPRQLLPATVAAALIPWLQPWLCPGRMPYYAFIVIVITFKQLFNILIVKINS